MTTKHIFHFDIDIPNVGDLAVEGKLTSPVSEDSIKLILFFTPEKNQKKKSILKIKVNNGGHFVIENINNGSGDDTFHGEGIS